MSLTLYWNLGSQPARAVKCLLDIGKLSAKLISLDIVGNETRTKEFMSMNPLGQIPFLTDGDFKVGQSSAILVYLCQKYPENLGHLYGNTPKQRAKVNQHLGWYQNFFRPSLFKLIYLKIYQVVRRGKTVHANQIKAAEKEMLATLTQFQQLLKHSGTPFVAGNSLSIADLLYFFELTNLIVYEKEKVLSSYKLISNWYSKVGEIAEVKAIQQQWNQIAPGITKMLQNVPIQPNSKL